MNEPKLEVLAPATLAEEYPLLVRDAMAETMALFDANLAGQPIEILNLQRIKVPPGGLPDFLVETAEGDTTIKKLEGLNLASRAARVYFSRPYGTGGKKIPDCTSKDGFIGVGDPGGACKTCPNARFGTALRPDGSLGAGQACHQVTQMLFLLPGEKLPHLLAVPPTSTKAYTQFLMTLISAGVPHWGATTVLTLEQAQNEGGIKYSRIRFRLGRKFPPEAVRILEPYRLRMRELLIPSIVDASAYEIIDDEPPAATQLAQARETVEPPPDEEDPNNPIPF